MAHLPNYSQNPLVKKLGIKEGDEIILVNVPENYDDLIGSWPRQLIYTTIEKTTNADFMHFFTQEMGELEYTFPKLKMALKKGGGLWVSWPKASSKLIKDLNGNDVRKIGLENGLVDVKVCAIDADWSGIKFMYRTKSQ